ncbi:MAG: hypothetical protein JSV36_21535 [Anaerolineae bacterium]|nr:MAG: hypothetical protein JSV36_21535 [Anaerolineae bacterium]
MRKSFVVGWIVLALGLLAPRALAQGEGVIEVQVLNGTEGGGSVEGLTVTLRAFQGMTDELESQTGVADAEGRVRFEGLDTSPDITYVLGATYTGVDYGNLPLTFEQAAETILPTSFQVYEATENPDQVDIQVERTHMFVDFEDGVMSIGELHIFSNVSDRTFIGVEDADSGQRLTLRFALPEGATGLRFQMGGEGDRYVTTADGFADTEAVQPGASQQILYGYTLGYGEVDTFDLVRPLSYPTLNLNVLVPRVGIEVTSNQVELNEIRTVEGQAYLNLNGRNFAAGDELSVRFAGLQGIAQPGATPEPGRSGLDPRWIALGLAALALAVGVIYPSLRRSGRPVAAGEPAGQAGARLSDLIKAIADLDDALESGSIDEANYHRQRQALKSEALALMQES